MFLNLLFTPLVLSLDPEFSDGLIHQPGTCILRDKCGRNPDKPRADADRPCLYNQEAEVLPRTNSAQFKKLLENCPDLAKGHSQEETYLCCNGQSR